MNTKGCGWFFVLGVFAVAMMLAGLSSTMPEEKQTVNVGTRPTSAPSSSTVTIRGFNGPKEKPVSLIGAWIAMGVVVVLVAVFTLSASGNAAEKNVPGAGCGGLLAFFALGIVLVVILLFVVLAQMGS